MYSAGPTWNEKTARTLALTVDNYKIIQCCFEYHEILRKKRQLTEVGDPCYFGEGLVRGIEDGHALGVVKVGHEDKAALQGHGLCLVLPGNLRGQVFPLVGGYVVPLGIIKYFCSDIPTIKKQQQLLY